MPLFALNFTNCLERSNTDHYHQSDINCFWLQNCHREYDHAIQPLAGKQKVTGILVLLGSIQITKGTWHLREQCVLGYLSPSPHKSLGTRLALHLHFM